MLLDVLFGGFVLLGVAGLAVLAARERRGVMRRRGRLLDAAAQEFPMLRTRIGRDGFPGLSGRLPDGRLLDVELVPDTLQVRRLPQLWLKVTVREAVPRPWPRIGALARPTGAEFYSLTATFPERLDAPTAIKGARLLRGDGRAAPGAVERMSAAFDAMFGDDGLKEAAVTPNGIRIVRQAAEGDRGAHLLLRQIHFPVSALPPALVHRAIANAARLRAALEGGSAGAAHPLDRSAA